jgi:hypothetical protein
MQLMQSLFFFSHSATDLMRDKFELHVALEGTIESTSMNFQVFTSYKKSFLCDCPEKLNCFILTKLSVAISNTV